RVQLAMGDSRAQMLANVAKLVGTVPGALGGYAIGQALFGHGMAGLIAGLTAGSIAGYLAVAWMLRARGLSVLASDLRWTALGLALGAAGGYGPWALAPLVGVDAPLLSLVLGTIVIAPYAVWSVRLVAREVR